MQSKFALFSLLIITLLSCSKKENEKGNLHLTGNIEGLGQGKIYIQKLKDTSLVIVDSIILKGKSNFDTYLQLDEPEMIYLFLDRGQTNSIDNNLNIFAEPGEMNISTTLKEFFASAKITGSKNHDLYNEFLNMRSQFTNKKMEIIEKEFKNQVTKSQKTADSIKEANQKLVRKKYLYVANFAVTHADKEVAPYLALTEIADIHVSFLDSIQNKLSPKIAKSKYSKMLKEHIEKRKQLESK